VSDIIQKISSLFSKRKAPPALEQARPIESEKSLQIDVPSMNDSQIAEWLARSSEREVLRALHGIQDSELQLRVLRFVDDEELLKKVSRSRFDKRVRRQAEKKLREKETRANDSTVQELEAANRRIQEFLDRPDWDNASELVREIGRFQNISDPASAAVFDQFQKLRKSLEKEVEAYERTCLEMEEICERIETPEQISKSELGRLRARWSELEERYRFPPSFGTIARFDKSLELRGQSRQRELQARAEEQEKLKKRQRAEAAQNAEKAKRKREEERKIRAQSLDQLLSALKELSGQLGSPHADSQLRQHKAALQDLGRFKAEFPGPYKEAEALLKVLSAQRSEAAENARWDSWARTDRAKRIEEELEKLFESIQTEADPELATQRAMGLSQKLFDASKEMRELGSLERDKDQAIWEKYKALSDKGWALCEQMRGKVLEILVATVSGSLAAPVEFSKAQLADPKLRMRFRPEALETSFADRMKELRNRFAQIGARRSEAGHDMEFVVGKLFETYFREFNLYHGKLKREELESIKRKQQLLSEMKARCENASVSLIERANAAKRFEERWRKEPVPESAKNELESEFDAFRERLSAEIVADLERQIGVITEARSKAESIHSQAEGKTGLQLSKALQSLARSESEINVVQKTCLQLFQYLSTSDRMAASVPEELKVRLSTEADLFASKLKDVRENIQAEIDRRLSARRELVSEAETLARLSGSESDWNAAAKRFEELKQQWKQSGAVGQSDDAQWNLLFSHLCDCFGVRFKAREKARTPAEKEAAHHARGDLLCALAALGRFETDAKAPELPLGFEESPKVPAKILELGLRYRQILALDPKEGVLKETCKIMEHWGRIGDPDEDLSSFWGYYLARVHSLLKLS